MLSGGTVQGGGDREREWLPTEENLTKLLRELPVCPIDATSAESKVDQLIASAAADMVKLKAIGLKFMAFVQTDAVYGLNSPGINLIISALTVLINRSAAWESFATVQEQLSARLNAIGTPFEKPSLLMYIIDEKNGMYRFENTVITENLLMGLAINVFTMRGVWYQGDVESLLIPRSREWHPNQSECEARWHTERMEETFILAEDDNRHWTLRSSCILKITQMLRLKGAKCVDMVRVLKGITAFVKSILPELAQKIVRTKQSGSYYKPLSFVQDHREYDGVLGIPLSSVILFYNAVFREHGLFKYSSTFHKLGETAFEEGGLADIVLSILMAFQQGGSDVQAKKAGHIVSYASAVLQMMSCGDSIAEPRAAFVLRSGNDLVQALQWAMSKGTLIPEKASMLYDVHSGAAMTIATMFGRAEGKGMQTRGDGSSMQLANDFVPPAVIVEMVGILMSCAKGEKVSSITNIAFCCKELSRSDQNLKAMVAAGILDAIVIVLTTNDDIQRSWNILVRWNIISARESVVELLLMLSLSEKTIEAVFSNEACRAAVGHAIHDIEYRLSTHARQSLNGVLIQLKRFAAFNRKQQPPPSPQRLKTAHVLLSYCWAEQPVVKRIRKALRERGYNVWIDLENLRGSAVDAMSQAINDASVILYGVSEAYKVSANCRLEANYAHSQNKVMIPLMLQTNYKPSGWLGVFLGTRLWYGFFGTALDTDDAFEGVMDQMSHELARHATPTRTPPTSPLRPKSIPRSPMRLSPCRSPTTSSVGASITGFPARPPTLQIIQGPVVLPATQLPASSATTPLPSSVLSDACSFLGLPHTSVASTAIQPRPQPRTSAPQEASTMSEAATLSEATTMSAAMIKSSLETCPHVVDKISKRVLLLNSDGRGAGAGAEDELSPALAARFAAFETTVLKRLCALERSIDTRLSKIEAAVCPVKHCSNCGDEVTGKFCAGCGAPSSGGK